MRFLPWAAAILSAVCVQANEWHAYYRLTSDAYQAKFNDLVGQGYRLNSVSGYERSGQPNFAVIFEKKSSVAWKSHHGMTSDAYQKKFNEYLSQGYRVVQVNGYTVGENAYYAAIWDKSPSAGWVTRHGMTVESMQKYFDEYLKQGYKLTHISGYELKGEERFAAIWEKKNDNITWLSYANMTSAEYQSRFDKYVKDGYRLIDVDGYQVDDHVYYAAIWDKSASGAWVARHGLDSPGFQAAFDKYKKEGYVLRAFSGYNAGKEDRYAGLWIKP
ncbi:hypothetical protein CNMCM5793_000509 [Aspergillus hiratsukae]|uniref:Uncharacterized protein n=1 Tax=Aspergillus hiratsukae TaxID=1194566 RepID=A0A8H6P9S2_9EURO|nr:hypothetical protein CNMCM5793_000509 [Aspergillus hiratsukae]KAF7156960.1 hypothetical protein CNMCM6106_001739 [Aspergillus hiratsukae]